MSDKILCMFKIGDPTHSNEEVIRWMSKILGKIGITSAEFWVWTDDQKIQQPVPITSDAPAKESLETEKK